MSSKDAEGTLKKSQKRDIRKRCGARRICRMVVQVCFIWSHQKSNTHSKHQKKDWSRIFVQLALHIWKRLLKHCILSKVSLQNSSKDFKCWNAVYKLRSIPCLKRQNNFKQQPNESAYVKIRFKNSLWNHCIWLQGYWYLLKLILKRLLWNSARWKKNLALRRWWRWRAPYSET